MKQKWKGGRVRLITPASKTGDLLNKEVRGFKSHPFRQKNMEDTEVGSSNGLENRSDRKVNSSMLLSSAKYINALWCNGNTFDFDSKVSGSSPDRASSFFKLVTECKMYLLGQE